MNIKLCVKLGRTLIEIYKMLQTVSGKDVLSCGSVSEWFKRFKGGDTIPRMFQEVGVLKTSTNADIIANVREMVKQHRPWALRIVSGLIKRQ